MTSLPPTGTQRWRPTKIAICGHLSTSTSLTPSRVAFYLCLVIILLTAPMAQRAVAFTAEAEPCFPSLAKYVPVIGDPEKENEPLAAVNIGSNFLGDLVLTRSSLIFAAIPGGDSLINKMDDRRIFVGRFIAQGLADFHGGSNHVQGRNASPIVKESPSNGRCFGLIPT